MRARQLSLFLLQHCERWAKGIMEKLYGDQPKTNRREGQAGLPAVEKA